LYNNRKKIISRSSTIALILIIIARNRMSITKNRVLMRVIKRSRVYKCIELFILMLIKKRSHVDIVIEKKLF
jgi:hypothetical protein